MRYDEHMTVITAVPARYRQPLFTAARRMVTWFVALAAVATVAGLAIVNPHIGFVRHWDLTVAKSMARQRTPGEIQIAHALSAGGSVAGLAVITVLCAAWLWWRHRTRLAAVPILAFGGAEALAGLVKQAVGRTRPPLTLQVGHEVDWSFPSGHATATTALLVSLAILTIVASRKRPRYGRGRAAVIAGAALLGGALMAWSRLVLDVHWSSDVLTGWVLGTVWGALVAVTVHAWPQGALAVRGGPREGSGHDVSPTGHLRRARPAA